MDWILKVQLENNPKLEGSLILHLTRGAGSALIQARLCNAAPGQQGERLDLGCDISEGELLSLCQAWDCCSSVSLGVPALQRPGLLFWSKQPNPYQILDINIFMAQLPCHLGVRISRFQDSPTTDSRNMAFMLTLAFSEQLALPEH